MKLDTPQGWIKSTLFLMGAAVCLLPFINPPMALLGGFLITLIVGNPFLKWTQAAVNWLLQASIVGLGFGMNLLDAAEAGKEGFWFTLGSISITLLVGLLLGKILRIGKNTNILISIGTAICGGSAIAAIAPVLKSKKEETSVALATIFVLNSVALILFPLIGEALGMTQNQFGLWSAVAIHDTSSVVGAAQQYGEEALHVATTVKLERALWIIPVSLLTALLIRNGGKGVKIPWFILLFAGAMAINTFLPQRSGVNEMLVGLAKKGITLTLFLIGAGLTVQAIKKMGIKPLFQGIILWVFVSILSLLVILELVI